MITAGQLESLAETAERFGAGGLELTGRGNVQVRGITDTSAVADAVAEAGLLPSPTHERVRNIVASPLSGRLGGVVDVRPWVKDLDHAIQAAPDLTRLPGRFLFSVDDGSADVSGLAADVGVHAVDRDTVALLMAGRDTGIRLTPDAAIGALVTIASRFAQTRGTAWRIRSSWPFWSVRSVGFVRSVGSLRCLRSFRTKHWVFRTIWSVGSSRISSRKNYHAHVVLHD